MQLHVILDSLVKKPSSLKVLLSFSQDVGKDQIWDRKGRTNQKTHNCQKPRAKPAAPWHYFVEVAQTSKWQTTKVASYDEPYDQYKYIYIILIQPLLHTAAPQQYYTGSNKA